MSSFNPLSGLTSKLIWGHSIIALEVIAGFDGIETLVPSRGYCLRAGWTTDPDADFMNIYIKHTNATNLFTSEYLLGKFPNISDHVLIRTEANPNILLSMDKIYFVGVKREIAGVEDSNTASLSMKPYCINPVWVNDRHVGVAF